MPSSPTPIAVVVIGLFGLFALLSASVSLLAGPVERYATVGVTSLFFGFVGGALADAFLDLSVEAGALGTALGYIALYAAADLGLSRSPAWQEKRAHRAKKIAAFKRARKSGLKSVVVDGRSYSVPTSSSSSSGGGGFSGGGGSSGGGGASGGW